MKVAIIQYSTYGHVTVLAKEIKKGVEETKLASQVDIFQVPETLSEDVLKALYAPAKPTDIPVITNEILVQYDAFLFGVPTRFGTSPAQWNEFWGQTGGLWASGALHGKPAGVFVSTGTPGGGQEATIRGFISYLAHHGIPYIPLGYGKAFAHLSSLEEPRGGSPWGAGSFAGADGSRQPSETELAIAKEQGESFARSAIKFDKSPAVASKEESVETETTPVETKPAKKEASKAAKTEVREAQSKVAEKETQGTCSKCTIM